MNAQPSLFDAPAQPTPCPPWLVEELVALGVRRETAAGYSMRQAFGVRDRLKRQHEARARAISVPSSHEMFPPPEPREQAARDLEHALARTPGLGADPDYVCRLLREAVCFLSPAECGRVAKGLIPLLREKA